MNDSERPSATERRDPTTSEALLADEAVAGTTMLRRRRLLKIGAGAAPASLMLVGRPVHAFTCNSTSAWGSAQVNPSASVNARTAAHAVEIDGWSLSEWVANTTHGSLGNPWNVLFQSNADLNGLKNKTIENAGVVAPAGLTSASNLFDALSGTGSLTTSDFQKYMLVALLNQKLLTGEGTNIDPSLCLPTIDLTDMADGSYSPTDGVTWGQSEILNYLQGNGLARP